MNGLTSLLLVIGRSIISASDTPIQESVSNDSNRFSDVVASKFFVDKTLLIKDFLSEYTNQNQSTKVIRVLTPPGFGKTTNNNMLKTFLEITVNEKGERQNIEKTNNYKVFEENNLNIFKEKTFKKHFGKHPVISINYKKLRNVTNFDHMIDIYREILKSTFSEHKYLLSVDQLWQRDFNKSSFELYFDEYNDGRLHKYYIFCGFSILSEVLRVHFERPVFVLLDDFDAVEDCPAYITGEDKRRIHNYVKEVNDDLLVDNENLAAALLLGTLRKEKKEKKGNDKKKKVLDNVTYSTTLWRHYGLSQEELKTVLSKFIDSSEELRKAADTVIKQFSGARKGYNGTIKHQICSILSVKQYLDVD